MSTITFNANGIKIDGKHIHGKYNKNFKNGYENKILPYGTIVIKFDTDQNIIVPGLVSTKKELYVMPNNRNYKNALLAYKKARSLEINRLIKRNEKKLCDPNLSLKIRQQYETEIKKLKTEQKRLNYYDF